MSDPDTQPATKPKKRIVVCSDGTWNDPEDENPTNVLRVARAIAPEDEHGVQQVVFYDWGVGSYYAEVRGGVSGLGIMKNIQDGYRFIVQNYDVGDEIFLFGFSRGAYTSRAIAGMLNKCGILKRKNADKIDEAFDYYKNRKVLPGSTDAKKWRKDMALDAERGTVRFIGVWDTVGALGIPTRVLAFVEERDLFYDHEMGSNLEIARHAVAIDERRDDFAPTLWVPKESIDLKQVWFAGVHGDIGGGTKPKKNGLRADIALAWMAREADAAGLRFESHLHGPVGKLHEVKPHESYKTFWKIKRPDWREIPDDAVLHDSVRKSHEAWGYAPRNLKSWLKKRDEDWGALEK